MIQHVAVIGATRLLQLNLISTVQVAAACQSWREQAHLQPHSNGSLGERHPAWLLLLSQDGSRITSHTLSSWHQVGSWPLYKIVLHCA